MPAHSDCRRRTDRTGCCQASPPAGSSLPSLHALSQASSRLSQGPAETAPSLATFHRSTPISRSSMLRQRLAVSPRRTSRPKASSSTSEGAHPISSSSATRPLALEIARTPRSVGLTSRSFLHTQTCHLLALPVSFPLSLRGCPGLLRSTGGGDIVGGRARRRRDADSPVCAATLTTASTRRSPSPMTGTSTSASRTFARRVSGFPTPTRCVARVLLHLLPVTEVAKKHPRTAVLTFAPFAPPRRTTSRCFRSRSRSGALRA